MMLIDAHAHLWKQQKGRVDGAPVYSVGGGKSNFGGQVRQMMPTSPPANWKRSALS